MIIKNFKWMFIVVFVLMLNSPTFAWWNTSWGYRQAINISNTAGNLTNYQVKIELNSSKVGANFNWSNNGRDIRFTNSTDDLLSHWIEYWNSSSQEATIWIKVPFLENNTNTTIYMYYGNPSAESVSNGSAVFEFFDDFEGTSLDTDKWDTYTKNGTISVENSMLHLHIEDGNSHSARIISKQNFTLHHILEVLNVYKTHKTENFTSTMAAFIDTINISSSQNYLKAACPGGMCYGYHCKPGASGYSWINIDPTEEHDYKIIWTTQYQGSWCSYVCGNGICVGFEDYQTPTVDLKILLAGDSSSSGGVGGDVYYDTVFVRAFATPEPSVSSIGCEEFAPFLIALNFPPNQTITNDSTPEFNFTVTGFASTYSCRLFLNDTGYGTITADNNVPTIIAINTSLPDGIYNWYIKCSDNYIVNKFNNSLSKETLTFIGSQNITRYIRLPKNANVTSAHLKVASLYTYQNQNFYGINITEISASGWLSSSDFEDFMKFSNAKKTSAHNVNGEQEINYTLTFNSEIDNITFKHSFWSVNYPDNKAGWTWVYRRMKFYNYTSNTYQTVYEENTSIGDFGRCYIKIWTVNITPDFISNNTIKINYYMKEYDPRPADSISQCCVSCDGEDTAYVNSAFINFLVKAKMYPSNLYIQSANSSGVAEWSWTGEFTSDNGTQTVDLNATLINNYLSTCTPVKGYCNVPILFHSDSTGLLEVSDIEVNYSILSKSSTSRSIIIDTIPPTINWLKLIVDNLGKNNSISLIVNAYDLHINTAKFDTITSSSWSNNQTTLDIYDLLSQSGHVYVNDLATNLNSYFLNYTLTDNPYFQNKSFSNNLSEQRIYKSDVFYNHADDYLFYDITHCNKYSGILITGGTFAGGLASNSSINLYSEWYGDWLDETDFKQYSDKITEAGGNAWISRDINNTIDINFTNIQDVGRSGWTCTPSSIDIQANQYLENAVICNKTNVITKIQNISVIGDSVEVGSLVTGYIDLTGQNTDPEITFNNVLVQADIPDYYTNTSPYTFTINLAPGGTYSLRVNISGYPVIEKNYTVTKVLEAGGEKYIYKGYVEVRGEEVSEKEIVYKIPKARLPMWNYKQAYAFYVDNIKAGFSTSETDNYVIIKVPNTFSSSSLHTGTHLFEVYYWTGLEVGGGGGGYVPAMPTYSFKVTPEEIKYNITKPGCYIFTLNFTWTGPNNSELVIWYDEELAKYIKRPKRGRYKVSDFPNGVIEVEMCIYNNTSQVFQKTVELIYKRILGNIELTVKTPTAEYGVKVPVTITWYKEEAVEKIPVTPICGNGVCEPGENWMNCPQDCKPPVGLFVLVGIVVLVVVYLLFYSKA